MDERLKTAWATALNVAHQPGARVEVHLGSDIVKVLRERAGLEDHFPIRTIWGFPIRVVDTPDLIEVHAITTIY